MTPSTLSLVRVRDFLARLHGFYRVWEPWVETSGLDREIFAGRGKLRLVEDDLRRLGEAAPEGLPAYPLPFGPALPASVFGSLYVMEGSMLGAQVISRWMAEKAWAPEGGLAYFNGYGRDTGRMWRTFQQELSEAARIYGEPRIVAAANTTFERLQGWLGRQKEA